MPQTQAVENDFQQPANGYHFRKPYIRCDPLHHPWQHVSRIILVLQTAFDRAGNMQNEQAKQRISAALVKDINREGVIVLGQELGQMTKEEEEEERYTITLREGG